jgi:hypothetical protein
MSPVVRQCNAVWVEIKDELGPAIRPCQHGLYSLDQAFGPLASFMQARPGHRMGRNLVAGWAYAPFMGPRQPLGRCHSGLSHQRGYTDHQ